MSKLEIEPQPSGPLGPPLADSMNRVLADPLTALRASMEALISDSVGDAPHGARLEGALNQITRLARDVQSLVELAQPRELAPLDCSLEELARSALRSLPPLQRGRVEYARPVDPARMWVDGPTLTRAIAGLLAGILEDCPGGVLLHTRQSRTRSSFSFVHTAHFESRRERLCTAPDEASRSVRLAVAQRDVARMGGEITTQTSPHAVTCMSIELPNRCATSDHGGAA